MFHWFEQWSFKFKCRASSSLHITFVFTRKLSCPVFVVQIIVISYSCSKLGTLAFAYTDMDNQLSLREISNCEKHCYFYSTIIGLLD